MEIPVGILLHITKGKSLLVKNTNKGEIINDKGTEKGNAVVQANKLDWVYTVVNDNGSVAGDKIVVKAYDMPGNETKEEKVL